MPSLTVGDYVAVCPHSTLDGRVAVTVLALRYNLEQPGVEALPLVGAVECEHCEAVRDHMTPAEWPAYIQGLGFALVRYEGVDGC